MNWALATKGRRSAAVRIALTPLLICLVVAPPGMAYVGLASSMAMGSMVTSCLALALAFGLLNISSRRLIHSVQYLPLLVLGVILHLLVASLLGSVTLSRSFASLVPLCVCISGAWAIAQLLTYSRGNDLGRRLNGVILILGLVAALGAADLLQPAATIWYPKPVFPFTEPSHLAMVSAPFLIFSCVRSRPGIRVVYLAAAFIATALLENLTMAAVSILATAVCVKPRYLLVIAMATMPILPFLDLSYYLERLEFTDQSQNLSALVYLQGWQVLIDSLERTNGLGVGFQQLGVSGASVTASDQIALMMGDSLNLLDGGFTLAKLLSEFGVFGALLLAGYLYYLIRSVRLLRRVVLKGERPPVVLVFAASCIVGYLIDLLLRGTGYFSPTGMLLVSAIFIWRTLDRSLRKEEMTMARANCRDERINLATGRTNAGSPNASMKYLHVKPA